MTMIEEKKWRLVWALHVEQLLTPPTPSKIDIWRDNCCCSLFEHRSRPPRKIAVKGLSIEENEFLGGLLQTLLVY
jgi:hypothetical protein